MSEIRIRKIVDYVEDILIEGGRPAPTPLRMAACAAIIQNPWVGRDFVEDLQPEILGFAPHLSDALVPRLVALMGGPDHIEAFGKAAIVGTSGEVEHAAGLIHTLHFGNAFRMGADGNAFLPFINKRSGPGMMIAFPLTHKREEKKGTRSHFLSLEFAISDAPAPDELVVVLGAASGGRPHHRIGDRFQDMKAMGVDQTGKPITTA
ncbi:amino acid synthesis family protein [Phyllobacterium sp. SB3]|uniref:amino acid synthesis family protein n=1 Tax=Phyllobacterium sp. SB3 TaxID=3156073 RepID=UPI0032AF1900